MSLFKSLADIFTGLPPRREQPNDQQTSDIHSPQHRGCSPANRSSSHSAAAPPSTHIQFPRQGFPPRSQLNSAHISSHRLPPNRDTAARLQVRDNRASYLHFFPEACLLPFHLRLSLGDDTGVESCLAPLNGPFFAFHITLATFPTLRLTA